VTKKKSKVPGWFKRLKHDGKFTTSRLKKYIHATNKKLRKVLAQINTQHQQKKLSVAAALKKIKIAKKQAFSRIVSAKKFVSRMIKKQAKTKATKGTKKK